MQSLVSVVRGPPRDRGKVEDLAGRLFVTIRVSSRASGDGADSYLHVGSGLQRIVVDEEELRKRASGAKSRAELEKLVQEFSSKIELDYAELVIVGGKPVIPGSSVKGNVRSRIELSLKPKNGKIRSCLIRDTRTPVSPPPKGKHGYRHFMIWKESLSFYRGEACEYVSEKGQRAGVCLVCDLFGTSGLKGVIEFGDFVGDKVNPVKLNLPGNEKIWAVPPGSVFQGKVDFQSLKDWELGLLLYGMGIRDSRLGRLVLLGKHKYRERGSYVFGLVRFQVEGLELSPLSRDLSIGETVVKKGEKAKTETLDGIVSALVSRAKEELRDELLDIDEVGRLEQLES